MGQQTDKMPLQQCGFCRSEIYRQCVAGLGLLEQHMCTCR
jgi:hypothetical protein